MNVDDFVKDLYTTACNTDPDKEYESTSTEYTYTTGTGDGVHFYPQTTTGDLVWSDHTITAYPSYQLSNTVIAGSYWPMTPGEELGVVYIEGDEIKLQTRAGKIVTIARLDDSDDFLPIEVIAAKKKLIEDPEPDKA